LHNTTAFIIIRNDSILYEKYFNSHTRDAYCKSFSVSKNFISALVGIALDEKLIQSVDDPVVNYIPEFKSNIYLSSVTIRHCLSGTTGFPANNGGTFPWHDNVKVYYSSNIPRLLSTLKYETKPGSFFQTEEYSSCLLGLVLEKATKMTVSQYLSQKLWKPLGMEYSALWVLDNENNGLEVAMSGLTARPIDFAKFGCLYLKNGTWNNKQIISNKWIHESTAPDTNSLSYWDGGYYTDTWWGTLKRDGTYEYSANGHFSQRIYIAPAKNSVIVRFGTQQGGVDWSQFISKLIKQL
jgi:CubicO group peptidase (beta-lactamase class C family)